MKIFTKKMYGGYIITDLDNGEKIDITRMGTKELEELQSSIKLSQEDFDVLQTFIIDARISQTGNKMAGNHDIKTAQENIQFNPDFDIKKTVKNEDDAAGFITSTILNTPDILPGFMGMSKDELFKKVSGNLYSLIKDAPPQVLKELQKAKPKDFTSLMSYLRSLFLVANPTLSELKYFIYPLMGYSVGSKDLIKRLYDYVPLIIKGTGDIEKEIGENQNNKQTTNSILDQYNKGDIDKTQMETMMREFSGYRPVFVKLANGIKIEWKKDKIIIAKNVDGKYIISKTTWENIGREAGWFGRDKKKCDCGSNLEPEPIYDLRGVFLFYACQKCKKNKKPASRYELLSRPQMVPAA